MGGVAAGIGAGAEVAWGWLKGMEASYCRTSSLVQLSGRISSRHLQHSHGRQGTQQPAATGWWANVCGWGCGVRVDRGEGRGIPAFTGQENDHMTEFGRV